MARFALVGARSGQLLTYMGRILLHDNRAEMEFLFPGARVVRVSDGDLGQAWMWVKNHPDMSHVQWPLRREDFVR